MRKRLFSIRNISGFFILFILLDLLFPGVSLSAPRGDAKITVVYFYTNSCEACRIEEEFAELFNKLIGDEKEGIKVQLSMYNTFHTSGSDLLKKYYSDYNVPKNRQVDNMVFIGGIYLSGQEEIESRLKNEFINAKVALMTKALHSSESNRHPIKYFYVTPCSSCGEVDTFLETVGETDIDKYNINQSEPLDLIKKYFDAYKVPEEEQRVPIIFIGDTYLSGANTIKKLLNYEINRNHGLDSTIPINIIDDGGPDDGLIGYNIVGVLLTGFINGLNPCSFSMLLFLLSILVAKNVNILKIGFTFIVGKFVTYFLLGTLLFNIFVRLDIPHFQIMSKVIMAVILVFIAILNLSDSFAARREDYERIRMQLPIFLRKKNHQWINKFGNTIDQTFLMPLSLMLGVLVSLGEFLCTGQIYLATIISILHDSKTLDYRAIIYFILYGVSFVLPLILATIFVYKGRQIFELTEWLRGKMPVVKLVNAIIFVLFAVFILIWL